MTLKNIKTCEVCQDLFRGRANAKTCSAKCRKRLQRAKEALYVVEAEVDKAEKVAVNVVKKVSNEVRPTYATQEGFIGGAPSANSHSPFFTNLQQAKSLETPPAPEGSRFSAPMSSSAAPVAKPEATESQPVTVVHNHYAPLEKPFRRHIFEATVVLLVVVAAGAIFSFFNTRSNQANLKAQSETIKQLASSISSNNFVQNPTAQSKLNFNVDTVISDGKKLSATGQVAIQNEADSSHAFTIQNAQGDYLLNADTTTGLLTIGNAQPGRQALAVNGDITATGAITSNGAVISSGGLSANNGSTTLSNNGLTINNVLVCTSAGCSSSKPIPNDIADLAYTNVGQTFVGDNTFTGQTTFKAISTKAFQIQNATGTDNIFYVDTNNNRIGIGTIPINGGAALQVAGSIDISTGGYQVGGTSGTSLSCPAGQLLQQAIIQGGVVTSGSCVAVAGATTPSLQQVYDASTPAKIGLSSASGQLQIQDSASPLGTDLFSVANNGASTTYFAVNNLGINVTGSVNTTGQYQINGTQIASTDLGDSSSLARLNGTQTFTGANTFSNAGNSFAGDGSGLTNVNASKLNGQAASFYTDAGSLSTGTLSDSRLSANVTKAGNSFNGASQLVQLTAGGLLPILSGANLTSLNASNIASGTLSDNRLSANVALLPNNNTFTGDNSFHLASTALTVQDASTPLGTDLFEVTDSAGTTKYLAVSASGVKIGAYDVCTTAGNCAGVGGGVTTAGGTTNKLAKFTASNGIGDSIISDNGTAVTVAGNLGANNITQNGNNVCDTSGNCVGVSGGGVGGSGTAGKIALFTGSGYTVGDSILTQATTTVTAAGSINVTGSYELNGTQVDSTILSNDGNLAKLNGTQTFTGANTFSSASNSFTGDGSGLTGLNGSNILTGTIADARLDTDVVFTGASQTFSGINNFTNASNSFTGDGSGLTALNAANISSGTLSDSRLSNNVALLNGTGPQTFTGNNKFAGTVLAASTGASAVTIQNATGSSTLFNADTSAMRVAIGQASASYTLDVAGDINTSGAFRVGGAAGTGITCTSGNVIQNPVVVGGIITGGTCVANGGGVTTTLQDAYNNSSSPALITTSSSTKGILLKAGSTFDSNNLFQVENAAGNNMFNVNSNTSSVTIGGATNSATAFQVQNSSGQSILGVDSANSQVNVGVLNAPTGLVAMQPPAAPTVTPTGTAGSTSYSYEVVAVAASGIQSLASSAGSASTGNATLTGTNFNALSWSAVTGASSYYIYRTSSSGTPSDTGWIGTTNTTSFNDTGITSFAASATVATTGSLSVSTTYFYEVTALDGAGNQTSASSEVSITTSSSYKTVSLSWTAVTGARSYRVYRGTTSGGENTYYTTYANAFADTGATGTSGTPPVSSTAYVSLLSNSSNATLTLNSGGTAAGQIYVGGATPTLVGSVTIANAFYIVAQGHYAYVAINGTAPSIRIVDTSNPAQPVVVGSLNTASNSRSLAVAGQYAYIAGIDQNLYVINIANPSSPTLVSSNLSIKGATIGNTTSMVISGQYLYILGQNGLEAVDISKPASPVITSRASSLVNTQGNGQAVVYGSYLYTAGANNTVQIFNLSNPAVPVSAGSISGIADAMTVQGSYLYVSSSSGVRIFSLANPTSPTLVGYNANTSAGGAYEKILGRYLYNDSASRLNVIDISNPANPVVVGSISNSSSPNGLAIVGRYMYELYNANTLRVFDLGGAYIQNLETGGIETGDLNVTNNENILGSANIVGGLNVGASAQVAGTLGVGGNLYISGSLQEGNNLTTPQIYNINNSGTAGTTSYSYAIAGVLSDGRTTAASSVYTTTTGNATLNGTNFNQIQWTAVTGASSYNIYRTASSGSPSTTGLIGNTTGTSFNDTGLAGSGTAPTADTTGGLSINGNTTFNTGSTVVKTPVNSLSAFQVQNSSSTALLSADTTNMRLGVDVTFSALSAPSVQPLTVVSAPSAPTVTPTGTTGSTSYSYKITALLNTGFTTDLSAAGSTSTGNTTLDGTNYNALSWSAVTGATTYYVYRTSGGSATGLIGTTSATSLNDTGLAVTAITPTSSTLATTTTYYYKITALDANGGETTGSTEVNATTTSTGQVIGVTWTPVSGATSYRIYRGTASGSENIYVNTVGKVQGTALVYTDAGMSTLGGSVPTTNTAYKPTNTSTKNLQLTVGGNGTPTGQIYVGGQMVVASIFKSNDFGSINGPQGIAVKGNYAYVPAFTNLDIIDITNPTAPYILKRISASVKSVVISGKYMYASNGSNLFIYDISIGGSPVLMSSSSLYINNGAAKMVVSGNYLYTEGNAQKSISVVDVSNPASPKLVGQVNLSDTPLSFAVSGSYLYVDEATSDTLEIFNISNPTAPTSISSTSFGSTNANADVAVTGHYAYLSGSVSRFQVIDISSLTSPSLVSSLASTNGIGYVVPQGRYVYFGNNGGIAAIDISNPATPFIADNNFNSTSYFGFAVQGRYAYGLFSGTLDITDLGGTYTQALQAGTAEVENLTIDGGANIGGDAAIVGGLSVAQSVQVAGNLNMFGGAAIKGGVVLNGGNNQLSVPAAPTVTPVGTSGSSTYNYVVTALNASGGETTVSSVGTTTTGNATLSATNYNTISWSAVSGASSYKVYRYFTNNPSGYLIGTTTSISFNDVGNNANSSLVTLPTINSTGQLVVQGSSLFRTTADSSAAFQIQSSQGYNIFNADSSNLSISVTGTNGKTFLNTWGSTGDNKALSVAKTSDGGYAITGYTSIYGAGSNDMFIAKYDSSGNLTWNKVWGGTGGEQGNSIVQTSDGGYAVTGSTTSFGAGSNDMFIAKYDSSGNLSWNKVWGGTGTDIGNSIVQTSGGGYAITGYTSSLGAGNNDMFIAKYDSSGNLSWNKVWGSTNDDQGNSIVQTSDGGYAVTGSTRSFGAGSVDMFIAKYDSSGNVSWNNVWGSTSSDTGYSIIQTSDGGYAVTGQTFGFGNNGLFVVKYDSSGNVSWNKTWGNATADVGKSIIQTSDGGYAVTGLTSLLGAYSSDVVIVKFDSSGNLSWNKTWGGSGTEIGSDIIQTSDGGYAIAGSTSSYGTGTNSAYLLKVDANGILGGCSTNCASPTVTISSPSATTSSPSATTSSPSATTSSPSATTSSPSSAASAIYTNHAALSLTGSQTVSQDLTVSGGLYANGSVQATGSALFQDSTNSITAFQIQNSSGTSLLAADTSGMKIAITGNLNVSGNLEVGGYLITDGGMYATSLPGSPVNGQEVYYDADPTNGVVWHLRYNSTSTYWEYLGGSSFYSAVETSETAPGTWGDMATVGPSVTVPLAGDYIVSYSTYVSDEASAGSASVGVAINGTENASTTSGLGMNSGDLGFGQLASTTRLTLSASDVVKLVYQASGSSSLQYRHLTVTPVRVH